MARVLRNRLRELIDEKPSALGTFITLGDPVAIFEHVYETLPPRLLEQRAEALDDARPS